MENVDVWYCGWSGTFWFVAMYLVCLLSCRICSNLDNQFGDILKDTQHFLCAEKGEGSVTLDEVRHIQCGV